MSHHQCAASSSTARIDPALIPPICAVMRAGSLKTLRIDGLSEPDPVMQVMEELPHCTHLSELNLDLNLSLLDLLWLDEVRHVTFVCSASTV